MSNKDSWLYSMKVRRSYKELDDNNNEVSKNRWPVNGRVNSNMPLPAGIKLTINYHFPLISRGEEIERCYVFVSDKKGESNDKE